LVSDSGPEVRDIGIILTALVIDFFIIRHVWRAANKGVAPASLSPTTQPPRRIPVFLTVLITLTAVLTTGALLFSVLPKVVRLTDVERQSTSSPSASPQNPSFGPVIERVVTVGNDAHSFYSFDRGDFVPGPTDFDPADEKNKDALWKWLTANHVDVFARTRDGRPVLVRSEMVATDLNEDEFDTLTPAQLAANIGWREALKAQFRSQESSVLNRGKLRGDKDTFAFESRFDVTGLVQVVGVTSEPPGVKIRYKLIVPDGNTARSHEEISRVVETRAENPRIIWPNGITCEVVGVLRNPRNSKAWFRPDGTPFAQPPAEVVSLNDQRWDHSKPKVENEVLVFYQMLPGRNASVTQGGLFFDPKPISLITTGKIPSVRNLGDGPPWGLVEHFELSEEQSRLDALDLSVNAVATDAIWESVATCEVGCETKDLIEGVKVVFSPVHPEGPAGMSRQMEVQHNIPRDAYAFRLFATLKNGERKQVRRFFDGVLSSTPDKGLAVFSKDEFDVRDVAEFVLERTPLLRGRIPQIAMRQRTETANAAAKLSFGPVIEREVAGVIDFDSGKLARELPDSVTKHDDIAQNVLEAVAWMEREGFDAITEPTHDIKGVGMKAKAVNNDDWDKLTPDQVITALAAGKRETWLDLFPNLKPDEDRKTPATWVFETREGGKGILQVLQYSTNGVNIRYKLVQTGSNQPSSTPALPDVRKAQPIEKSEKSDSPPQAKPRNAIRLTVRSQFGQKPIPEFRVLAGTQPGSAGGSDATVNWQPHTLRSGKDGILDWPLDIAYDPMMLRVEADGWIPATTAWFKKSEGAKDISITLAKDLGISGRVLTPEGKPAAGATLALAMIQREAVIENGKLRGLGEPLPEKASDRRNRPVFVQTDADGRFVVPQHKDPSAALLIVHESGVREMPLSDIERASEITLQEWGRIEGRALWGDRPGTNEEVTLSIQRNAFGYPGVVAQYEHVKSDADGRFVFDKVLPGRAQISRPFTHDGSQIVLPGLFTLINVKAGGSTPALVGGCGRIVKGRLTGRDSWQGTSLRFHPTAPHIGFPGDDAMWAAFGEFRGSAIGPIFFRDGLKPEPDGSFTFPKVLPGKYQLFVDDDGGNRRSAGMFTVDPEKGEGSEQPLELGEIALKGQ
jgi:hypothetical protein